MRGLIIIVLVVALMIMGGWLVVNLTDNSAVLEVRTDKIKEDTSSAVEKAKETFRDAKKELNTKDSESPTIAEPS